MPTSSARPADLDTFVAGSRAADVELRTDTAKTNAAYKTFGEKCTWGTLHAESLLNAYHTDAELHEGDARWVVVIGAVSRNAGGTGPISSLPASAIAASLRRAGLSDTRGSI